MRGGRGLEKITTILDEAMSRLRKGILDTYSSFGKWVCVEQGTRGCLQGGIEGAKINEIAQKIKKRNQSRQETGHIEPAVFMKPLERVCCRNVIELVQNLEPFSSLS